MWALGLKPFYAEFIERLNDVTFKQHLMRYFMEFEVVPARNSRISDIPHATTRRSSSSFPAQRAEMAREMVADARILPHQDITAWFSRWPMCVMQSGGLRTQNMPEWRPAR